MGHYLFKPTFYSLQDKRLDSVDFITLGKDCVSTLDYFRTISENDKCAILILEQNYSRGLIKVYSDSELEQALFDIVSKVYVPISLNFLGILKHIITFDGLKDRLNDDECAKVITPF